MRATQRLEDTGVKEQFQPEGMLVSFSSLPFCTVNIPVIFCAFMSFDTFLEDYNFEKTNSNMFLKKLMGLCSTLYYTIHQLMLHRTYMSKLKTYYKGSVLCGANPLQ